MTIKQLKKRQEELDNEILKCPDCSGKIDWGWYKEFGCKKSFDWGKCSKCGKEAIWRTKSPFDIKFYCKEHKPKKQ